MHNHLDYNHHHYYDLYHRDYNQSHHQVRPPRPADDDVTDPYNVHISNMFQYACTGK